MKFVLGEAYVCVFVLNKNLFLRYLPKMLWKQKLVVCVAG